ncbi:MAG: isoprenylcysteine carboxylmethyltransferase family protein [Acidimicrobiales bacterium]
MLWLRSAIFTLGLPGTVLLWVPICLSTLEGGRFDIAALRWFGVAPLVTGAAGLVWCIWDFGRTGKGTLAPIDPPRCVVGTGLYRRVRNPMYVSVLTVLGGEVLLLGSVRLAVWSVMVAIAFHLFVVAYEEPTLRSKFKESYEAYCRAVPRWWPKQTRHDPK